MDDLVLLTLAVLLEFVGPALLVVLLIWGVWWLLKARRLGKSLKAARGDAVAMRMERTRLTARALSVLGIVAALAVLAIAMGNGMDFEYAFVCAACCYMLFWFWSQYSKERYNREFKEHIVTAELSKVFDDLHYEPDGVLGEDILPGLDLFAAADRVSGNDLISARYKDIAFEQGDVQLEVHRTISTEDAQGNTRTDDIWETCFQGRAMRFHLASALRGPVQVVRRDFSAARVLVAPGDWQRVETELAAFGEAFEVFARDPLDAMSAMTPQMIEGIHYLDQKLNVPLAFHFEGQTMYVCIALTHDAFDVSGRRTLLEERELLQADIGLITGFLDTMYFKGRAAPVPGETASGETAGAAAMAGAAVLAAPGPQTLRRAGLSLQGPFRVLCLLVLWLPLTIWAVSAVLALLELPNVALSFSSRDGVTELDQYINTFTYLLIGAFFIAPTSLLGGFCLSKGLNTFLLGGGSGISGGERIQALLTAAGNACLLCIPLWLHLFLVWMTWTV